MQAFIDTHTQVKHASLKRPRSLVHHFSELPNIFLFFGHIAAHCGCACHGLVCHAQTPSIFNLFGEDGQPLLGSFWPARHIDKRRCHVEHFQAVTKSELVTDSA